MQMDRPELSLPSHSPFRPKKLRTRTCKSLSADASNALHARRRSVGVEWNSKRRRFGWAQQIVPGHCHWTDSDELVPDVNLNVRTSVDFKGAAHSQFIPKRGIKRHLHHSPRKDTQYDDHDNSQENPSPSQEPSCFLLPIWEFVALRVIRRHVIFVTIPSLALPLRHK